MERVSSNLLSHILVFTVWVGAWYGHVGQGFVPERAVLDRRTLSFLYLDAGSFSIEGLQAGGKDDLLALPCLPHNQVWEEIINRSMNI